MAFDLERARDIALEVWKYKQGEVISLMIHLGDRLGLYAAMAGEGPMSAATLAGTLGFSERWVQEWLLGQAAAGLIERDTDEEFHLTQEAAAVLADENSLLFAAGAFAGGTVPQDVERVVEAIRTGRGFTYGELGLETATQIDRMNRPWLHNFLIPAVVSQLDGIPERLAAGGRVADVGCGGGVALEAFAAAFPAAELVGVDPSRPAIDIARRRLAGRARVSLHASGLEDVPVGEPFDLVVTLDCMHDLPRPDLAAAAIKRHLADDGVWLIKDMRCSPVFEDNLRNPLFAMQYGFSVITCLASATSTADGFGLGTLGFHPDKAREIIEAAGFTSLRLLKTDDPAHYYYEIRP